MGRGHDLIVGRGVERHIQKFRKLASMIRPGDQLFVFDMEYIRHSGKTVLPQPLVHASDRSIGVRRVLPPTASGGILQVAVIENNLHIPENLHHILQEGVEIGDPVPVDSNLLEANHLRICRWIEDGLGERPPGGLPHRLDLDEIDTVPGMDGLHGLLSNLSRRPFYRPVEIAEMEQRVVVLTPDAETRQGIEITQQQGRARPAIGEDENIAVGTILTYPLRLRTRSASDLSPQQFAD